VAQLPVFWALFNVLKAIAQWTPPAAGQAASQPKYGMTIPFVESAHQAKIFGISLYDQFLHPAAGETLTSRLLIVVFVLISAATTFLTMRQSQRRGMMNQTAPDPDAPGAAAAASMSKNMMYIAPFFALTGLYWQFGLVLYWVTTNVWTLGQQHFLFRKLPVVGSATVGASAVQAASGNSGAAAKAAPAKNGSSSAAAKAGARPAGAKPAGTKPAGTRPAAAKPAGAKTTGASAAGAKPAAAKPAAAKQTAKASVSDATPVTPAVTKANGSAAVTNGTSSGPSMLRRFSRNKEEEPQDVPAVPPTKVVRQQPVRQARSKRGNTGKR
jgi:YidC/Oxa1 family membrane protein insertase